MSKESAHKDLAKSDFIERFSKLKLDADSLTSVFVYMRELDVLLEDLYNTGYNDGFQKAVNIDVNKN